ncbi:transposase [Streptococcus ovis]|uniref:transposase n=1 Tax=Streptococcus ovis TaxID=82806 RepID=UPI000A04B1AF
MPIPVTDYLITSFFIVEVDTNMEQFPITGHLSSWAGLCPDSYESVGIKNPRTSRKGIVISNKFWRCLL